MADALPIEQVSHPLLGMPPTHPDRSVTFNTWGRTEPQGIASECELLVSWPYNSSDPLVKLKKTIVNNMYFCVEQYHHPRLDWEYPYQPWWHDGIAHFFGAVLWPGEDAWGYREGTFGKAIWHWAHGSGWSLEKITDWMKARRIGSIDDADAVKNGLWVDREDMSQDPEFTALFHSFARAAAGNKVVYASGAAINITGFSGSRRGNLESPQLRGEEKASIPMTATAWYPSVMHFFLRAGHVLDISAGHADYVVLNGADIPIDRVANASIYRDVQISYWEMGKADLGVEFMEDGEARIAVPNHDSGYVKYEFLATCTGGTYSLAPLQFKVRRIL